MSTNPPEAPGTVLDESEETYCYLHPKTPTKLRCSRCDRPICGRCAIPATVGQHCPECVAEARKSAPKVRTAMQKNAPVTMGIIAITIAFFVLQQVLGDSFTFDLASRPARIAEGEWYRLVTPMVLHAPNFIFHILMNMYVLFIFGPQAEQAYGSLRFLAAYITAGFTGGAMSYAFSDCFARGVGASGAVFGVAGMLLVFLYRRRRQQFIRGFLNNMLFFIGINLVLGFVIPNIDNWAHIGGLLGGIGMGAGFDSATAGRRGVGRTILTLALVIAAGLALVLWRTETLPVSCRILG